MGRKMWCLHQQPCPTGKMSLDYRFCERKNPLAIAGGGRADLEEEIDSVEIEVAPEYCSMFTVSSRHRGSDRTLDKIGGTFKRQPVSAGFPDLKATKLQPRRGEHANVRALIKDSQRIADRAEGVSNGPTGEQLGNGQIVLNDTTIHLATFSILD